MDYHLIICSLIFIFAIASFCWGKLSMATTSMTSLVLLMLTGCLDASTAAANFGNANALLMVSMGVVAAAFGKTQFVDKLASGVGKMANGSVTKVTAGYVLMAAVLTQFIASPTTVFAIVAPLAGATLDSLGMSRSKVMFPVALTALVCCVVLPFGSGATTFSQLNGYLEASEYTTYAVELLDPMKARLPLMIVCILYSIFIAPRTCPENPVVPITFMHQHNAKKEPLPRFQEISALVVFFGCTIALVFAAKLGLKPWQVTVTAALLMVLTGVLKPKEAVSVMPIWLYLLFVGALSIGSALVQTGAGDMIGTVIAGLLGEFHNEFLIYLILFLLPFITTQFMQNLATGPIFYPIVINACKIMGANPVGPVIAVSMAVVCAFMTPMATATVPQFMGEGGYDVRTLLKISWLPALIFVLVSAVSLTISFPLYG